MSTYRSLYLISLMLCSAPLWSTGCEKSSGCTVNSDCGTDALCRETVCRPKCQTYITCAEGEACVDGACETPTADYCSHVVPAQTPPEMGPYAPCAPVEMGVEGGEMLGGEMTSPIGEPGGMSVAGETAAGEAEAGSTAGEAAAGETAAIEVVAGEATAGESSAGNTAGDAEESAGELEFVGGQTE